MRINRQRKSISKGFIFHFELGFKNASRGIIPKEGENYEAEVELSRVKTDTGAYKKGVARGRWVKQESNNPRTGLLEKEK